MNENKITLYTKTNCPQCKMVSKLLKDIGVEINEKINLDEDVFYIEVLKSKGVMSVPYIEGNFNNQPVEIRGFRPDLLRKLA